MVLSNEAIEQTQAEYERYQAIERLRLEAKKLGCYIVVPPPYVKLIPCICGCTRRSTWHDANKNMEYFECKKCGYRNKGGKTNMLNRISWNEEMRKHLIPDTPAD